MSSGNSPISPNNQHTSSVNLEDNVEYMYQNSSLTNQSELYLLESIPKDKPLPNYKPALIYSNAGLDDTRHIGKTKVVIVDTST